jgi:hypothetical protein
MNNSLVKNNNTLSKKNSRKNEQRMLFKLFKISDHKEITLRTNI